MTPLKDSRLMRLSSIGRGLVAAAGIAALLGAAMGVAAAVGAVPSLASTPAVYIPLAPSRVLDTRTGNGLIGPLTANSPRTLTVINRFPNDATANVPSNAIAITGNLTVTGPSANGFVSLTLVPVVSPTTSSINFVRNQTVANAVTAPLGGGGSVSLTYGGAATGNATQVILDITGYFMPGSGGATGPEGPQGPQGPGGANGADGATGPQGPAGATGPTGPSGAPGETGAPGASGEPGASGAPGASGEPGASGAPGASGEPGASGAPGASGGPGASGAPGPSGEPGASGAPGATGPAGPVGYQAGEAVLSSGTATVWLSPSIVGDYSVSLTFVGAPSGGIQLWVTSEGPTNFTINGTDLGGLSIDGHVDWIAIPNLGGAV